MNAPRPIRNLPPVDATVVSLIKNALATTSEDTVGINLQLDRDVHEILRRLNAKHGWTNREVLELAARVLDAELREAEAEA